MPDSGMAMTEVALFYHQQLDWHVLPARGKAPIDSGWPDNRLLEEQIRQVFAKPQISLGVALGAASRGLVDVDCDFHGMDYQKAIQIADALLPPTPWVFGRASKPNSHRLYSCSIPPPGTEQCKATLGTVIELRSTGGQTIFPPSMHISGEDIEWHPALNLKGPPPSPVDVADLRRAVNRVAMATYLMSIFPEDGHEVRMFLAGWLAFQGWPEAEVIKFSTAIMEARAHGAEGIEDVVPTVTSTFHRLANGEHNKGFPSLKQALNLDKMMTGALRRWETAARPPGAKPHGGSAILTDYGVAEPVAFDCLDDLRYCPEQRCWYVFDKKFWRVDDEHRANSHVVAGLRKICEAFPPEDEKVRAKKVKDLRGMETRAKTESILTFMEGDLVARVDQFDADPYLLNCQNGVLDLKAGTIERHSPGRLQVSLANAAYDPTAQAPIFEKFIAEMLPDDDVRAFIQGFLGYCLTGLVREHIFPIFHGPGANGKSTLFGAMMDTLGTYAGPVPSAVVTMSKNKADRHPTELAALYKKRLAVTSESEQGKRLDESAVKTLTGGDTISVRRMREDPWDLRPTHKLVLLTNYVPQIWGQDEGIWRRLVFVPCEVQFTGARDNKNLREQLRGEYSGILNWCLAGLKDYFANGLKIPSVLAGHAKDYRGSQDEVLPFLEEQYVITGDMGDRVPASALYMAYRTWCALHGAEVLSAKSLGPQYHRNGLRSVQGHLGRQWAGLRLKTKEEMGGEQ